MECRWRVLGCPWGSQRLLEILVNSTRESEKSNVGPSNDVGKINEMFPISKIMNLHNEIVVRKVMVKET